MIPCRTFVSSRRSAQTSRVRRFFSIQLRHMYLGDGEVWTTDDVAGAALWAPPTKSRPGLGELLHLVPVLPDLAGLGRNFGAAMRLLQSVERARPHDEHWYLATLGTDPPRQGQGVGSALLRAVLERADAEGTPAYLESSKERNLPFYGRHGFEVTGEIHTPGGPTLWLMWRDPRAPPPVESRRRLTRWASLPNEATFPAVKLREEPSGGAPPAARSRRRTGSSVPGGPHAPEQRACSGSAPLDLPAAAGDRRRRRVGTAHEGEGGPPVAGRTAGP